MFSMKQPASIDGIEFDALIEKSESYSSDIPKYPVEKGYVVSDNITLQPLELSMKLFVTNTPVTHRMRHGLGFNRVDTVESRFLKMRDKKELVTIVTASQTYKNMGLTSVTFPYVRSGAMEIDVKFREVIVTSTEQVAVPASYGKSGSTASTAGTARTVTSSVPKPATGSVAYGALNSYLV